MSSAEVLAASKKRARWRSVCRWFVIVLLTATAAGVVYAVPWEYGLPGLAVFTLGIYALVRWRARAVEYICPECNTVFTISTGTDFISPHMIDVKLLKCPRCGITSWCRGRYRSANGDESRTAGT
ncbi:hypothetical protein GF377_10840 [candidate division GN15 bacterium]|nr:hypothetical protein [candidate division GN15 bacterium]